MPTERIQRQIDLLLDQAEAALATGDWPIVAEKARAVLAMDPENEDASPLLRAGEANLGSAAPASPPAPAPIAVDPERVAELAAAAERSGNPLDRLEEGIFVGRTHELERLHTALDDAVERRGSVVMLVGEPGIGKTRTTQELEAYGRTRGAQVLWGGAHETEGAPPYWPWVQLGRAYRDLNPEETRRKEWEPYAVELQRIFNLRALFPNLPEPPPADSEEAQFRLFDAMTGFLRGVAERTPLLLVLDDLHWADAATLQLLAHVGREVGRAPILILGTYRDTDLDRRHPLSRTLAQMNREVLFSRIALRGLTEPEVGDYLRRTAGIERVEEDTRVANGGTADSKPYRWPWHGAFTSRRTALLVTVDGADALPDEEAQARLTRVVLAAMAAGVTIGQLADHKGMTMLPDGPSDFVVVRPHIGGFTGTDLDSILRRRGITDIVFAGFPFELGADCTMRQANDLGYECLALTDCCTGVAPDTLAGAMSSIQMSGGIFGAVAASATVLELFANNKVAASAAALDHP